MNLVSGAMRRPVTIIVSIVAVVLCAVVALRQMPRDILPTLGIPVIYVAQPFGGLDPAQMEGYLTYYYEYHFLFINGIESVESKSIQGVALIKLQFYPGTDMAQALAETVNYANRARAFMPPGTVPPFVMRFDAGSVPVGSTFTFAFTAGGKYQYHCTFHQSLGMTGTVSVKIKATPPSGPMGTVFTITVASINAPTGFVYDIQMKKPGGSFQNWKPGTITKSVTWDSTGQPTGTYQFRSRLHNTSTNAASQYSAAKSIMVT